MSATQQILSADSSDPLPTLTCSVKDNITPVHQMRWIKGTTELASTISGQALDLDIASITIDQASVFGTYTCDPKIVAGHILTSFCNVNTIIYGPCTEMLVIK